MGFRISGEQAFALKLIFLKELDAGYRRARAAYEELLRAPRNGAALKEVEGFFHRIAGTAQSVDLSVLGHLASVCEDLVKLAQRGALQGPEELVRLLGDGLSAVAATLESHASAGAERPTLNLLDGMAGLLQPHVSGDERVLSKILVVDDDPYSAGLIDNVLRNAGFISSYCCSPDEALRTIQAELPDLIILDVVMPGMDGFDLCRRVRAQPALQSTPIIFVTRKGDVEQRVQGLEVGGNDYISKPFEPLELVARVRSHLQRLSALRDMAIRDGLTRCFNHKFFKLRLEQEVARARRYNGLFALAMLDIDRFKHINDTWGHPAGDAVLSHLANIVSAAVRSTDVVARYGGEEFGLLLVQATATEAAIICNRLRERIATHAFHAPVSGGEVQVPVTVSVGIAELQPSESAEAVLQRADAGLYEAKHGGRNQVRIHGPATAA
jgi:diguanylate cyclase (GGDEF)-like protein